MDASPNLSSVALVEQEDLTSSPGAGRDREQAVLGIGELVDPRATSVKDGRWSRDAEIGNIEGTGVVSVGESTIVFERDSRGEMTSCNVAPRFRPAADAMRPAASAKARRAPATLRPPFCFFGAALRVSSSAGMVWYLLIILL